MLFCEDKMTKVDYRVSNLKLKGKCIISAENQRAKNIIQRVSPNIPTDQLVESVLQGGMLKIPANTAY